MVGDIIKAIEERKNNLISLLNNGNNISDEKKHQLYGAINEINIILEIIKEHKNIELEYPKRRFNLVKENRKKFNLFKKRQI